MNPTHTELLMASLAQQHQAVQQRPEDVDGWNDLGTLLLALGQADEAISAYQQVVALKPHLGAGYYNLGNAFKMALRFEEAIEAFSTALRYAPDLWQAYFNLGNTQIEMGNIPAAMMAYQQAITINPNNWQALWCACFNQIPRFYAQPEEINSARQRYESALNQLISNIAMDDAERLHPIADAVGSSQPFFLAYQNQDDVTLQRRYGEAMCRIMSMRYRQWTVPTVNTPPQPDEKIRVGFVSHFFNLHSNWKIPIQGWVTQLDRQEFEVFGYSTGGKKDAQTQRAKQVFDQYVEDLPFEALCAKIAVDQLHVLIFPEVGMAPVTFRLAALRLAPIQCASWGHPQTSGLPTMDYFLSSDLMEPPEAQAYYTETLVRLPQLSIDYTPLETTPEPIDLTQYGVPEDAILYLCCQTLFKYLPQDDWIFPEIVKQVPNACFVFIESPAGISALFRARFERAFTEANLDPARHVVMLPALSPGAFAGLLQQGHIFLDTIGWSGCNSMLEAIGFGLPIVTMPGRFMRGRHGAAILTMMDVRETIVDSVVSYIALAVRLGRDMSYRQSIRQKIEASRHRLYRDKSCIQALGQFLKDRVSHLAKNI